MRRLPVYLILDCSESMVGDPLQAVEAGMQAMIRQLRSDPMALETAWISILTFSESAKVLMPLTELFNFQMPRLVMGSGTALGTALGAALKLLEQRISTEIVRSTADRRGDYKPIVFLLTDGDPTDKWEAAADHFKREFGEKRATLVAVVCGEGASPGKMKRITDQVVLSKNLDEAALKGIFNWVSASISAASQSVESPNRIRLEKETGLAEAGEGDFAKESAPDRSIYLHAKCLKNEAFYIMHYRRDGESKKAAYSGVASHAVADFDFGESKTAALKVASDMLLAPPPCPYCPNHLWAMCSCGHIHCAPDCSKGATLKCPWCHTSAKYGRAEFSVGLGRG
jgi:uncharacterized protein YegL